MARSRQAPQLLLAILVALVAIAYQERKSTFISVQEVPVSGAYVVTTLEYVTSKFNQESDDKYNFRIVRVLKIKKLVSGLLSPSSQCPYARGLLMLWGKSIRVKFSLI